MAKCSKCDKKIGFLTSSDGMCLDCASAAYGAGEGARREAERLAALEQTTEAVQQKESAISAVMLTTETAPNLNITKRIEIVTAECAFGMNVFKDMFIAISNVVGGRSETVQKAMRESRKTALYELKREAHLVGANAVVGVDLDYVEMGSAGSSMVMLVASGTAVVIEEKQQ